MGFSWYNLTGTTNSFFRVGLDGPTFFQGTVDPNLLSPFGTSGDLYIQHDTDVGEVWQKVGSSWVAISAFNFSVYNIEVGSTLKIPVNQQMIVQENLTVEGSLLIEGKLNIEV